MVRCWFSTQPLQFWSGFLLMYTPQIESLACWLFLVQGWILWPFRSEPGNERSLFLFFSLSPFLFLLHPHSFFLLPYHITLPLTKCLKYPHHMPALMQSNIVIIYCEQVHLIFKIILWGRNEHTTFNYRRTSKAQGGIIPHTQLHREKRAQPKSNSGTLTPCTLILSQESSTSPNTVALFIPGSSREIFPGISRDTLRGMPLLCGPLDAPQAPQLSCFSDWSPASLTNSGKSYEFVFEWTPRFSPYYFCFCISMENSTNNKYFAFGFSICIMSGVPQISLCLSCLLSS